MTGKLVAVKPRAEHEEAFKSLCFLESRVFPLLTFNGTMKSTQTRII